MAAEDPRFLLHFKTLAKFNEKLADGTVSADKHLVFIKDAKQVWFKGTYYADNVKMDGITDFYNGWRITQSSATTLTITLTGKRWNANTRAWGAISKPLSVNSVTQSVAGLMSAADKVKLDGLNINNVSNISFSSDAAKVTATISKDNGNAADTSTTVNLPVASSTSAGSMSATDKIELDRISTANFALGAVTPNETTVGIAATKTVVEDGTVEQNPITLPASTTEKAGVQTAADKKLFDSIPDNIIILSGDKPVEVGQQSSHVTLTHNFSSKKEEGIYTHEPEDYKTTYIPAATTEKAGVMTAQDKVNLDETLPNAIAQEVQDRKDAIEALDGKSEAALAQEVADRKAADTALDTKFTKAVNDEATARTSADTALGARIDKEIADRTAADTTLETKLQNNINTLEAKHDAFVATKGKADGFAPLDGKGLVPANHLPSYVDDVLEVYATYDVSPTGGLTNVQLYTDAGHQTPVVGESGKIYINVTDGEPPYQFRWSGTKFVDSNTSSLIIGEIAGTAFEGSRGKHLEDVVSSMPKNLISKVSIANKNKRNVIILCNYSATDGQGHYIDKPDGMVIPLTPATTQEAGLMDADSVIKLNQTLPDAIEAEQEARIAKDNAHDTFNSSLPGIILTGFTLTHNSTNVRATLNNKTKSAEGKTYEGATDLIRDILAATKTTAGVMTAADKVKLDVTLPNLIDSNKTNIDNYTVNGFKISTNPVLDGADIKITGYTKPSTTGALAAADSVNGALGKLEKKLDDEVTNRTNAVSNLTNTVNSNKSTIDNYTINGAKISTNPKITVTVGGSGNAVTTASFSGTVLTLTKGATYNNYSHPAGSGASKSTGLYKFSTDSTSHISGVTAVTKSDITALGIPSSDTNTTYSFSSGNGGFTVTPSGGSSQTVSIGKPSTAGTADKVANTLTFTGYQSKSYNGSAAVSVAIPSRVSDLTNDSGYITSYTDTKNTTGSTNSSSKLYLVGATSQASSPVTYSNSGVYTQSGAVYASAGFYDTSDMRVKDNIESIDVSKADKIRLVEFDRTDREHHGYGVIAQELETVYPSMVNTDENGFKTVNYSEIYAVKIKYLEDKIAALEAVVDKLISK